VKRYQSKVIPEDGQVVLHLGEMQKAIEDYMSQQPYGTSLGIALRELIAMGLSAVPPETAIHLTRMRAFRDTRAYALRRMIQAFEEIKEELATTAIPPEEE